MYLLFQQLSLVQGRQCLPHTLYGLSCGRGVCYGASAFLSAAAWYVAVFNRRTLDHRRLGGGTAMCTAPT